MTSPQNQDETAAERLFLEQARAYYRDMKAVAEKAPDGAVIRLVEAFAMQHHRQLIRNSLRNVLQEQVQDLETTLS